MRVCVISSARWSGFWLSKHYVAAELGKRGHEVLYVDPPVSVGSLARDRRRLADLTASRFEDTGGGVGVWRPVVLPGQNSRVGQTLNARVLERGIRRHLGEPDVTVSFSLEGRGLLGRLPAPRVYWATDSIEDEPGFDAGAIRRWEARTIERVEVVVASSLPLAQQIAGRGCDPLYIPHGVGDDAFVDMPAVLPELAGAPRPLVGYVGSINFRIDPELLAAAAGGPGTLVVVGGSFGPDADPALRDVLGRHGVVTLGHRDPRQVPGLMAALDVGLVPYTHHPFNRKSFPLKVLQYLAAGVPVVSTPNGATDELGDEVTVIDEPSELGAAVAAAAGDRSDSGDSHRRTVARGYSWARAVDRVIAAVDAAA